ALAVVRENLKHLERRVPSVRRRVELRGLWNVGQRLDLGQQVVKKAQLREEPQGLRVARARERKSELVANPLGAHLANQAGLVLDRGPSGEIQMKPQIGGK